MREELEILMNRRWVLKSEEKELYYRLRDAAGEIRKFATEKMGCQIIANSLLIKMERFRQYRKNGWESASLHLGRSMPFSVFC